MKPQPIVDRLHTRLLERRQVSRSFVHDCSVLDASPAGLQLRTTALVANRMVPGADLPPGALQPGSQIEGRVHIDVIADSILRVRYSEGTTVPENITPMLAGDVSPHPLARVEAHSDHLTYATTGAAVEVGLQPFTLRVRHHGEEVCRIGGADKNFFDATGLVWDSYNTGICRTDAGGDLLAVEVFALRPHEAIYGFGEQFIRLNKVGQTIDLNMLEALGVVSPRSYKNVPFFMSTHGYGVFFNHSARMTCWVGSLCAAEIISHVGARPEAALDKLVASAGLV